MKLLLLAVGILISIPAFSQFDLIDKVKSKTTDRIDDKVNEGIDKSLDKVEEGVGKFLSKRNKNKPVDSDRQEKTEETINESTGKTANSSSKTKKLQSYTKYDFVPGDKVLFFEDFSQDAIGDFPALWTTNGGGEVKTINIAEGNWLHMNKEDAVYCFTKPINFPENFIVEFDIIPDENFANGYDLILYQDNESRKLNEDLYPGTKGLQIIMEDSNWSTKGYDNSINEDWIQGSSNTNPVVKEQVNHVIVWVQKTRLRIYHQGAKVLDMPTNIHPGTKFNRILFSGWSAHSTPYVSNIKITTAAPDTRSKLLTEGKFISYGITFDVNSDKVKPESYGALNDIANVLKSANVKVKIIGHTDSDGDDATNLDLSKRRASAVKTALCSDFGIDAALIQTDGAGESKPLAPNTTPEGKSKNRRVEFIKI